MNEFTRRGKRVFMMGNEAIVEGAIAAGARFYAGYPITPSSEIAERISARFLDVGGTFIQMEDELASMAAVIGASFTGTKAFTATSGPGFSLMQENLGAATMMEAPCVVVDVQRPGPSGGLATTPAQGDLMQAIWGRNGDQKVIVLSPSTVQECFDLTVTAFNLAERYRVPVVFLADEAVAHLRENLVIPDPADILVVNRKKPICSPEEYGVFRADADGVPPLADYGSEYIYDLTTTSHDDWGNTTADPAVFGPLVRRLSAKIENNAEEITIFKRHYKHDEKLDVLIITFGSTTRAARAAAMRCNDVRVGVLQLVTLWPFPDSLVEKAVSSARTVLVPELNLGQMVREVERVAGKEKVIYRMNRNNGLGFSPTEIMLLLEEVAEQWLQ